MNTFSTTHYATINGEDKVIGMTFHTLNKTSLMRAYYLKGQRPDQGTQVRSFHG